MPRINLVNADIDVIAAALRKAEQEANAGARRRLAAVDHERWLDRIVSEEEGADVADGGGVPNSYREQAETSIVAIAWWEDGQGRRHVRIEWGRVPAPKSAYGRKGPKAFGLTDKQYNEASCLELVYPELAPDRVRSGKSKQEWAFCQAIQADLFDVANRAAYADWLAEQGRELQAARQRRAIEIIQTVNAPVVSA